jgi:5-methylcytosine-specific restriction endonuclease McrA
LKSLPYGRDKAEEEKAFLDKCHRTKNRRANAAEILADEFFFDASLRPPHDLWKDFYEKSWTGAKGTIKGSEILSALRDHLAGLQSQRCCYCAQPLLKGGYARPIEHVLSRTDYPRFSLHFWNLAVACERCNRIKRDKYGSQFPKDVEDYPEVSEFTEQYHPRFHQYNQHIDFVTLGTNTFRYSLYVGRTDQGRNLVTSVLILAAHEEALESNDPLIAESMTKIRTCLEAQDDRALDKIAEFNRLLMDSIATQATGI